MALKRRLNVQGQQRLDVPHILSIESAVGNDFDVVVGKIGFGEQPSIVRGFTIPTTSTVGNPATQLVLDVTGGLVCHYNATESGTVLAVEPDRSTEALNSTNSRVIGGFTSSAVNYVGVDFSRAAAESTSDVTKFYNPNSGTETELSVPQALLLDYVIYITTTPFSFSQNICPVAQVQVDSTGNVVSITDSRPLAFRLGAGGDVPNPESSYSWRDTDRRENPVTYTGGADSPFSGGDKDILSQKEWMDAVMSVLWEAKSGESWYSPTSRDIMKIVYAPGPAALVSGDNFQWNLGTQTLTWVNLFVVFENSSGGFYNTISNGSAVLTDGQCLYVDIDRTSVATISAVVADLDSLPAPAIPGSRIVVAYRLGNYIYARDRSYEIGRSFTVATNVTTPGSYGGGSGGVLGMVRLTHASSQPANPVVFSDGAANQAFGVVGLNNNRQASVLSLNGVAIDGAASGNNAQGVRGTGGTGGTASHGVEGISIGFGYGVKGTGASTFSGVFGEGGTSGTDAHGVLGVSGGFGAGVHGEGSGTFSGVRGESNGTASGVFGMGGTSGSVAHGVYGEGVGFGNGVRGHATGTFSGVDGRAFGAAAGVFGQGGTSGIISHGVLGTSIGFGDGVRGNGAGAFSGVRGVGGSAGSSAYGVRGDSTGFGAGVAGFGSGGFSGVDALGSGIAGSYGIYADGNTTQPAIFADGAGTGAGSTNDAIVSQQNIWLSGSPPLLGTAFSARVTPSNILHVHGKVQGGGAGAPTVNGGFNNFSATRISDSVIRITIPTMANADYTVVSGIDALIGIGHVVQNQTTTTFDLATFDTTSGVAFPNGAVRFHFMVSGYLP